LDTHLNHVYAKKINKRNVHINIKEAMLIEQQSHLVKITIQALIKIIVQVVHVVMTINVIMFKEKFKILKY